MKDKIEEMLYVYDPDFDEEDEDDEFWEDEIYND